MCDGACIRHFVLLDKIVGWRNHQEFTDRMSFFLQGWKDENGVEVRSEAPDHSGCDSQYLSCAESGGDKGEILANLCERMNTSLKDALTWFYCRGGTHQATPAIADSHLYGAFGNAWGKIWPVSQLFKSSQNDRFSGYIRTLKVAASLHG